MNIEEKEQEHRILLAYITKKTKGKIFFWHRPAEREWIDGRMRYNVFRRLEEGATAKELEMVFDQEYKDEMTRIDVGKIFGKRRFWDAREKIHE